MELKISGGMVGTKVKSLKTGSGNERNNLNQNHHPTVKPVELMEYLVRLVTPKNGVCLDPFMGSGTTGVAAKNLGRSFIGIEMEKSYYDISVKRIAETPEPLFTNHFEIAERRIGHERKKPRKKSLGEYVK
jgi:DNA modification methylase